MQPTGGFGKVAPIGGVDAAEMARFKRSWSVEERVEEETGVETGVEERQEGGGMGGWRRNGDARGRRQQRRGRNRIVERAVCVWRPW